MSVVTKSKAFNCPHCRKSCSSQSGLTLHVKNCKAKSFAPAYSHNKNSRPDKETDIDPRISDEEFDNGSFDKKHVHKFKGKGKGKGKSHHKPKKGFGDIGAFTIFPMHMPALLDYDFAQALASFILENNCPNPALVAFARQIKSASNDEE
jgi:hypothetical protein